MKEPSQGGFGYEGAMEIMILSVVISIVIMMIFAGPVSKFVNEHHPTIQILGLSFFNTNWCDANLEGSPWHILDL